MVLAASGAFAQTEKCTLRGTVTDPSGAAVPGTDITVTETGTNVEVRKISSGSSGNYEAPDLKPGVYRVRADKAGFRGFIADSVLLDAGQTRRMDFVLQIGATAETITVEAGAALIQTETGTIAGEIDKKKYAATPLLHIYATPLGILTTTPGIQGNGWNVTMSGLARPQQSWAMDGVANDTTGDQLDNPSFFEAVQVTTVNAGADSARVTNFNMVSKRGANEFHGGVYYKHFNSGMQARRYFDPRRTPFIQHEWMAEASGPIWKDRTFFYGSWFQQILPLGVYRQASVPTMKMRAGDFSESTKAINDPLSGQPFPNKVIPATRFSGVSRTVQESYLPAPNSGAPGAQTNNYGWDHRFGEFQYKGDWPFIRIDHNLSRNNNLYVRWMQRKTPHINPGPLPQFEATRIRDHRQLVISDTHVISPALVNSFMFGMSTDNIKSGPTLSDLTPLQGDAVVKAIGLLGVNRGGFRTQGFPTMTISGITGLSVVAGAIDNQLNDDYIRTWQDSLTWSKGRHTLKFGAEYRQFRQNLGTVAAATYGTFNFNGSLTGLGYADFLLGLPYSAARLDPITPRGATNSQAGLYLTDSFKVTQRLTLDYGLRWDYYGIPKSADGLVYNWDPATGNVIVPQDYLSRVHPLYPTSTIKIVGGKAVPDADFTNFRPRLSAAYRAGKGMVIRGGYGEFSETWGYYARLLDGGPYEISETYFNAIQNGRPLLSFPSPFPSSTASAGVPSLSVTALPLKTETGVIRQWNFTLEREIHSIGLRASYIGSRGSGLNYSLNTNKPRPSEIAFSAARRPFPQFVNTTVTRDDGAWRYDSLQLQAQRRVGQFTFNAHWTWCNNLRNNANTENPYDVTSNWSRDNIDRRHYASINTTWAIPVGKGRRFLTAAPALVDTLLGGWGLQSVSYLATGQYFSPAFSGSDPSNTNTSGGLPDRIADGNLPTSDRSKTRWFDPSAFAVPKRGTFGNSAPNTLIGQGINVHHLSISKRFPITEKLRMTYTAAASNIFNRAHFDNPKNNISNPDPGMFTAVVVDHNPEKQAVRQIAMQLRLEF